MAARGIPDEPAVHSAQELDRDVATAAALILTMEKEQRGQVARVAPGTQAKTFTLTEAAALLDLLVPLVSAGTQPRLSNVQEVAAALHGLRGRLPLDPPSRRRRELHSTTGAWLSIPDGHNKSTSAHVAVVDGVRETSVRVATGLAAVMVETMARSTAAVPAKKDADHAAA
jgi:protein-tyrosine-phosphatase